MPTDNVSNVEIPFVSPREFLLAIYSARKQPRRVEILLARLDSDPALIEKFTEREITCLILLATAETCEDPVASPEEIHRYKEWANDTNWPGKEWADEYGETDWGKYFQANPQVIDSIEMDKKREEIFSNLRAQQFETNKILNALQEKYPKLKFLLSSYWWPILGGFDEIEQVYGQDNPFKVLSDFFGHYLYGRSTGSPLDGSPIPGRSSKLLKSITETIISKCSKYLDVEYVILAKAALGLEQPNTLVKILQEISVESQNIPKKLSGMRMHLVIKALKYFIESLPQSIATEQEIDVENSEPEMLPDINFANQVAAFGKLIQIAEWHFKNARSIEYFRSGMTASLNEAIDKNKVLILNMSPLIKSSSHHLAHIDKKELHSIVDLKDVDDGRDVIAQLQFLAPLMLLQSLDKLRISYTDFVMKLCPDAPIFELGMLSFNHDRWALSLGSTTESNKYDFIEQASLLFSEDISTDIGVPNEFRFELALKLSNELVQFGLYPIAAALIASWIEMQVSVRSKNLLDPLGISKAIAIVPHEYRRPIDIAISRTITSSEQNSASLLASIFPSLAQDRFPVWKPDDHLKYHLGNEIWFKLPENTRIELLAAESAFQELKKSNQEHHPTSYRAPFVNWGPAIERQFKLILVPVFDLLKRCDQGVIDKRLAGFAVGRGSLLELVNFVARYKGEKIPPDQFNPIKEWFEKSELKRKIFDDPERVKKWELIGRARNLSVHDGETPPTFDEILLAHIYLFEKGLLRELLSLSI